MRKRLNIKNRFIPVNVPKIFNQEKKYIKKCLDEAWVSSEGDYVKKFEEAGIVVSGRNDSHSLVEIFELNDIH